MGKSVTVLHWLVLTLGLVAAQAGEAFTDVLFVEENLEIWRIASLGIS